MRYISTRGRAPAVGFTDAVLGGLAPDGGLYVPEAWPTFSRDEIAAFAGRPYAEVAARVLGAFAGDEIAADDMAAMCRDAYASFHHAAVVPLIQIAPQTFIAELFHGPSLAFKDVAMQILSRLYDHLLGRQGRRQTILCATSGDTGGAAVEAFRGAANVRLVAMFPEGRISEVQRRFMTTASEPNIACVSVDGTFDDCQAILKDAFQDQALRQAVDLAAVNSINFARIAAQAVYYFTTAAALGAPGRAVNFVVPSGNFGDAFAGYVALRMGLPVKRIVVATNSNDILARAFQTGRYARGEVQATLSPAMDIQSASNFERLYFEATGRDAAATAHAFEGFARTGVIEIPDRALSAMRATFTGVAIGEAETVRTIVATLDETGELIDPHTAVAVAALSHAPDLDGPTVVLSTAHPAKFPQDVAQASGVTPTLPRGVADLAGRPERFDRQPNDPAAIKAYLDSDTRLFDDGAPVDLPAAQVKVKENRSEAFTKAVWRLNSAWTVDAGLRYEVSKITSKGDVNLEKTLRFAKPRVTVIWAAATNTQVRFRAEREVGQLNFDDFVASTHLGSSSGVTAGNPDLNPEQAWVGEITVEQRFWKDGLVSLAARHYEIKDAIDRGPVFSDSGVFDQPENIGSGTKEEIALNVSIPLDRFGVRRGLLKGDLTRRWSRVTDPTTHDKREISGLKPLEWNAYFSQDLPQWNAVWGIDAYGGWRKSYYRFNLVEDQKLRTYVRPYAEWRPRPDINVRVELPNITSRGFRITDRFYPGPRSLPGAPDVDDRNLDFGRMYYLRIRKTFGG